MRTKNETKVKQVTCDMPIAIALMILLGDKELRGTVLQSDNKSKLNALLLPFVDSSDPNDEKVKKYNKRIKENIYCNYAVYLKGTEKTYQTIYDSKGQYNFDKLIVYLKWFYEEETVPFQINTPSDIKRCYEVILKHQCETPNTRYTPEFCWKISSYFLYGETSLLYNEDNALTSIKSYKEEKDTYSIRRELVHNASGDIYITGTTLKNAFSTSNDSKNSSIIEDLIHSDTIENIYIFILNYKYLNP